MHKATSRSLATIAFLAGLSLARLAEAYTPTADCDEWMTFGSWGGPSVAVPTASLERLVGGTWVEVDRVTTTVWQTGGDSLLGSNWTASHPAGTYRLHLSVRVYGQAWAPPTTAELAAWPTELVYEFDVHGQEFLCGAVPPTIVSTAPRCVPPEDLLEYQVNAIDPNPDDTLTFHIESAPEGVLLDLNSGLLEWVPTSSQAGERVIVVSARDQRGYRDIQGIPICVAEGQPPIAHADWYEAVQGTTLAVTSTAGVLWNDEAAPGPGVLEAMLTAHPDHGVVSLNANGSFTYTPAQGFYGFDRFKYRSLQSGLTSHEVVVDIDVRPANRAPLAYADFVSLNEGGVLYVLPPVGVLSNDHDVDGDPIFAVLESGPMAGDFYLYPDGGFYYVPQYGFSGFDSFTYRANDGRFASNTATVTITVQPVNAAPFGGPDLYAVAANGTLEVGAVAGVLSNDFDPDTDPLTAVLQSDVSSGTLDFEPDGSFVFTPAVAFEGSVTFTYRASDGLLESADVTVSIVVEAGNNPPVAVADAYFVGEDQTLNVNQATGVLANDSDPESDPLRAFLVTPPLHGSLQLNYLGSFSYTPTENYFGSDEFWYQAGDGSGLSGPTMVSISIAAGNNDPPVTVTELYFTDEDTTLVLPASAGVLANDFDPEGATLTASIYSQATVGTLTLASDGSLTYVPPPNFDGDVFFQYRAFDGMLYSSPRTSRFFVRARNDPPVAIDDEYRVTAGALLTVAAPGYLANDSDEEGAQLTATQLTAAVLGQAVLLPSGEVSYQSRPNAVGRDVVLYQISDGTHVVTARVTFTVTATATNLPPEITSEAITQAAVDSSYYYDVEAVDPDAYDLLTYSFTSTVPSGMTIDAETGVVQWLPAVAGTYQVTVRVEDQHGAADEQDYEIDVRSSFLPVVIVTHPPTEAYIGEEYRYPLQMIPNGIDGIAWFTVAGPSGMAVVADAIVWTPGGAVSAALVEVTAHIQAGATVYTGTQSFTLSVYPHRGGITSDPLLLAVEGEQYVYDITVQDRGLTPIALALNEPWSCSIAECLEPDTVLTGPPWQLTWTPDLLSEGQAVQLLASDTDGVFAAQSFYISVDSSAIAPVVTSSPSNAAEDVLWTYQVIVEDPNERLGFGFELLEGPAEMAIDPWHGRMEWLPTQADVGSHSVEVAVTDSTDLTTIHSFELTVAAVNDPPVISILGLTNPIETQPWMVTYEVSDLDGEPVEVTFASSNGGLVHDPLLRTVAWTPPREAVGQFVVFTLTGDDGTTTSNSFALVIVQDLPEDPVLADPGVLYATEGVLFEHPLVAVDPDPNTTLTYSIANGPSGLSIGSTTGLLSWTPGSQDAGLNSVHVTVRDQTQRFDTAQIFISVEVENQPPMIVGSPPTSATVGGAYVYQPSVNDPGDPGGHTWSLLQPPPPPEDMTVDELTGRIDWIPPAPGTTQIQLRVTDSGGLTGTLSFPILVTAGGAENEAPVFTSIPPRNVIVGDTYSYTAQVTDDGPAPLTVTLVSGPTGLAQTGPMTFEYTPTTSDLGRRPVQLVATDGAGRERFQFFDIIVVLPEPPGGSVPEGTACAPAATWDANAAAFELEVISVVNDLRGRGVTCGQYGYFPPQPPLVADPALRCAARLHSLDMDLRGFYSHTNPDGAGPQQRAVSAGYLGSVAENIAQGFVDPPGVVAGWEASPGHCRNLMAPAAIAVGVGFLEAAAGGARYWTLLAGDATTVNRPPMIFSGTNLGAVPAGEMFVSTILASDPEGTAIGFSLVEGDGQSVSADGLVTWQTTLGDIGEAEFRVAVADALGATSTRRFVVSVINPLVAVGDPSLAAPPLPGNEIPAFIDQIRFLWESATPVVFGVDPASFERTRISIVRGLVRVRSGGPLERVRVWVPAQPAAGFTYTRADGRFDLAVNGGGPLTIRYAADGYLPAERSVDVPWNDWAEAPEVALVAQDVVASVVTFGIGASQQVARGTAVADVDGTRQATIIVPAGTTAEAVLPDGSRTALSTGSIRLTEYTVGADGEAAMPAELPSGTGYTYAVDLSIDEAENAAALGVEFSQPVVFYVENFLDFPVGGPVPVGYYDRSIGTWVPSDDGRIIEIISTSGGVAEIDIDGSGNAASSLELAALAITADELAQLASTYLAGDSLWRARLPHFSVADLNWPNACAGGPCAIATNQAQAEQAVEGDCERPGSIIECMDQTLGESLGVTGTGMTLEYRSDRVPGRESAFTVTTPVTGDTVPPGAIAVRVETLVAGRREEAVLPATPNQTHSYVWDGRDAYGRVVLGKRTVRTRIAFDYDSTFSQPATQTRSFGLPGAQNGGAQIELRAGRRDLSVWSAPKVNRIGTFDARAAGLGGWTLSAHHLFDPLNRIVYFGDGTERRLPSRSRAPLDGITFGFARQIDVDQEGRLYVADQGASVVWRIEPSTGAATIIAGTGSAGFSGDGGLATLAQLNRPAGVAVDVLGQVYISDTENHRIRRIRRDGRIDTVAGTGQAGFDGDLGVAFTARFDSPRSIDLGPDGSIYVADFNNNRIRRIRPDASTGSGYGMVVTVAGGSAPVATQQPSHGMYALAALLTYGIQDIALNRRGDIYFVLRNRAAIFQVSNDIIYEVAGCETIAGNGNCELDPSAAEDMSASRLFLAEPWGLSVDGNDLLLADASWYASGAHAQVRVLRITGAGRVYRVAGGGLPSWSGNGPRTEPIDFDSCAATDAVVGPDAAVYITAGCGGATSRLHIVGGLSLPSTGTIDVVADDGTAIFRFSDTGRHLATLDTLTARTILSIGYNADGYVATVADAFGNTTTIVRELNNTPVRIVAPFGQQDELFLDANDFLREVQDPSGASYQFVYTPTGLLTSFTDPMGTLAAKQYAPNGRLIRDDDGAGGFQTLTPSPTGNGYQVERTTALGRTTTFTIEQRPDGTSSRGVTSSNGVTSSGETRSDGRSEKLTPNGMRTTTRQGPDPRFGMDAPMTVESTVRMPSGLEMVVTRTATVSLTDPADPLSIVWSRSTTTVNGLTSMSTYDAATRTVVARSPEARTSTTVLDVYGRVIEMRAPGQHPVFYRYDSLGRLYETEQGTRVTTRYYNAQGFLDSVQDPLGRQSYFLHDAVGRVVGTESIDGRVTTFGHDANGNLIEFTPPARPLHEFVFDPRNLETEYRPPSIGASNYSTLHDFNLDMDPTVVTWPDGRQVTYNYLVNGTLDRVSVPAGDVTFTYETSGEIASITAPNGIGITYARDGSLVTDTVYSGLVTGTVHHEYDNFFRVVREDVTGTAPIVKSYDDDGLLRQAGAFAAVPRPESALLDATQIGSMAGRFDWSPYGELDSYVESYAGTEVYRDVHLRDALGRITQTAQTIAGVTDVYVYRYDPADRLEEVEVNGTIVANYAYDANDNVRTVTAVSGTRTATVDAQDRLQAFGSHTYAYNDSGQLTGRTDTTTSEAWTYQYDVGGNLTSVTLPDARVITYDADGLDRRITRNVDGVRTHEYLWSGSALLTSTDLASGVTTRYVYGTRPTAEYFVRGSSTYRIITDARGSVRLVVDVSTGATVQRIDYDAFGRVTSDTSPGFQPFGFAGGLYDADTGLVRHGARDYDAASMRWTAKDPTGFVDGGNLYAYVQGDPINRIDPTGNSWVLVVGGVIIVALALVVESYFVVDEARDTANNTGFPRQPGVYVGNQQDAFQHCLASCNLARTRGQLWAEVCGDANESVGYNSEAEKAADRSNNKYGRDLASFQETTPADCHRGCYGGVVTGAMNVADN